MLIYVPVLVPMMRKDVVAAWIKSVSALFVHRSAPIVAAVNLGGLIDEDHRD